MEKMGVASEEKSCRRDEKSKTKAYATSTAVGRATSRRSTPAPTPRTSEIDSQDLGDPG
jgi:hypothetical protein